MDFEKVHLEADALNVVSAIINREAGHAPIHLVYDSLISSLNVFDGIKASFVRRWGNTVAHTVVEWKLTLPLKRFVCPLFLIVFGLWPSSIWASLIYRFLSNKKNIYFLFYFKSKFYNLWNLISNQVYITTLN